MDISNSDLEWVHSFFNWGKIHRTELAILNYIVQWYIIYKMLHNHGTYQALNIFITPPLIKTLLLLNSHLSAPICFLSPCVCLFWIIGEKGLLYPVAFDIWLLSRCWPKRVWSSSVPCRAPSPRSFLWIAFCCMCTPHCLPIHPLVRV